MTGLARITASLVAFMAGAAIVAQLLNHTPLAGHAIGTAAILLVAIASAIWAFRRCLVPARNRWARASAVLMILAAAIWSVSILTTDVGPLDYIEYGLSQPAFSDRNLLFWVTLTIALAGLIGAYFYEYAIGAVVRWVNGG